MLPSLKQTYKGKFLLGNIMAHEETEDGAVTKDFTYHYDIVTAQKAMKPARLSLSRGNYDYANADKIIEWAEKNGLLVHGHTLLWHGQHADWLTSDGEGNALNRAGAAANMADYIKNAAGHFAGRCISWDVVNEGFSDSVEYTGDWRDGLRKESPWYIAYGGSGDYIYDAFKLARAHDPAARLYYNDFNEQEHGKSRAIAAMAIEMNGRWKADAVYDGRMLIEGIGMQAHYSTETFDIAMFKDALALFISTGAVIAVSELDITVGAEDPYPAHFLSKADERRQARMFGDIFQALSDAADHIERVTFWGKRDDRSWRRGRLPLVFDWNGDAKEGFFSCINQNRERKL
ncbi:MAG: endo-1,4-beta-xylanase [Clostridiales bacterium]|jgi:endo-1,4-beta-xylanase|nr:endo-1,4-beta-xylanase [Clostridiales bacterium]